MAEWADAHRVLAGRGAGAEPGPWRTSRTPYLREIMDQLGPASPTERIVLMKGAQIGGTEVGNNWLGYIIHHAPAATLMVLPTVEVARRVSKQRIAPMIEACPVLRGRVRESRSRDSGNTLMAKEFDNGLLIMTGANSAAGLRSMPIRYLFMDEVDEYPGDVDDQGDPVALAEERAATWEGRAKKYLVSTPKYKGTSRIEREWLGSDRRRYYVPCPECGVEDFLTWDGRDYVGGATGMHWRIEWPAGSPGQAMAVCPGCGSAVGEAKKGWMLEHGSWRPTAEGGYPGYHLAALYSPWKTWGRCAEQFVSAAKDPMLLKTFVNTVLGEGWEERGAIEPEALAERLEDYPAVPDGAAYLVAAVDTQGDRLEAIVRGYGVGEESWLVEHAVFQGDPAKDKVWEELDVWLRAPRQRSGGRVSRVECTAVDSGGAHTDQVYKFCRARHGRRVYAVKGHSRTGLPFVPKVPTVVGNVRCKLYVLCVDAGKETVTGRLAMPRPPAGASPGYMHLPAWVDPEYLEQLTAERPVWKWRARGGGAVRVWKQVRRRNEALDLEVYALAAFYILVPRGPSAAHVVAARAALLASAPPPEEAKPPRRTPPKRAWVNSWR